MLRYPSFKWLSSGALPAQIQSVGQWWLTAGVTPIAAYQSKWAASLSASYVNLANPGTYNITAGVAPLWSTDYGWQFDGINKYLRTNLVPSGLSADNGLWSMFMGFSAARMPQHTNVTSKIAVGCFYDYNFSLSPNMYGVKTPGLWEPMTYAANGERVLTLGAQFTSGVFGVAGQTVYKNGTVLDVCDAYPGGEYSEIFIGCWNYDVDDPKNYAEIDIESLIIFDQTLTASQVLALSTAMSAL